MNLFPILSVSTIATRSSLGLADYAGVFPSRWGASLLTSLLAQKSATRSAA